MLAPEFGIVDFITRSLGFSQVNWLGAPTPALISVIIIHT
jgi:multiple sugar transport system permease protein